MSDPEQPLPPGVTREATFSEIVEEMLAAAPGLTVEEILDRAYGEGWDLGDDPEGEVGAELYDDDRPYHPIGEERWTHLPSLLAGRVFTHRLTATELEHDVLTADPDLSLIQLLTEYPDLDRLAAGGALAFTYPIDRRPDPREIREVPREAVAEFGSVILPPGALAGLGVDAGDLVGLRLGTSGIELVAIDSPTGTTTEFRGYVEAALAGADPQECDDLVSNALVDLPELFREPLVPIGELLEEWGIAERGGLLAEPGFDWSTWRPYASTLAARYELEDDEADAAATILSVITSSQLSASMLRQRIADLDLDPTTMSADEVEALLDEAVADSPVTLPAADDITSSLEVLDDPHLAYLLLDESMHRDPQTGATGLLAAIETLLPLSPRRSRAALHWLRARGLDQLGDLHGHEEALRDAERQDPQFYPALVDLARLAGDRGDAAAGLALLSRTPDDVATFLRGVLADNRPQPTRMMPRNEPCWCGSGRKFKACHLRQTGVAPLPERTRWLYRKAIVDAVENDWLQEFDELTRLRVAHAQSESLAAELAADGLVADVVLFECGALRHFLQRRGALLPPDELLLAQQWLLTERSAYEVVEIEPGTAVTFRDLRTGDVVRATDRLASTSAYVGQLVCTHLLPQPDGDHAIYSIDPISLPERSMLLELLDDDEARPEEIVGFLSRRFAPPSLVNTEGHSLVMCEVRLSGADPTGLTAVLDDRYESAELDDEPTWFDNIELDGEVALHSTLTLDAGELMVRTNSTERRDAVLAELGRLAPDWQVVSQTAEPIAAPRRGGGRPRPESDLLQDDPDVQRAVADHIRGYEDRWIDLPVPALEGLTPREAAADPTRRDDLVRLLASLPAARNVTDMDPQRLRSLLGL